MVVLLGLIKKAWDNFNQEFEMALNIFSIFLFMTFIILFAPYFVSIALGLVFPIFVVPVMLLLSPFIPIEQLDQLYNLNLGKYFLEKYLELIFEIIKIPPILYIPIILVIAFISAHFIYFALFIAYLIFYKLNQIEKMEVET